MDPYTPAMEYYTVIKNEIALQVLTWKIIHGKLFREIIVQNTIQSVISLL